MRYIIPLACLAIFGVAVYESNHAATKAAAERATPAAITSQSFVDEMPGEVNPNITVGTGITPTELASVYLQAFTPKHPCARILIAVKDTDDGDTIHVVCDGQPYEGYYVRPINGKWAVVAVES
jgi:hypothetical protein